MLEHYYKYIAIPVIKKKKYSIYLLDDNTQTEDTKHGQIGN